MKYRYICDIILALAVATVTAAAGSTALAESVSRGGIIVPGPSTQVSQYENEWCAAPPAGQSASKEIRFICFGRSDFSVQATNTFRARAIVFIDTDGANFLYLETAPPAVELRSLVFSVYGPIDMAASESISTIKEIGKARVSIDARGEVNGVDISTQKFGRYFVQRPL